MGRLKFDIKYRPQIESGEYKVETRDGKPARVVCWDANSCSPIVFLVTEHDDLDDKDKEYAYSCNNFGRAFSVASPRDLLIITPEPELTEFEKAIKDLCWSVGMGEVIYDNDNIKTVAINLLDLARKEVEDELKEKAFNDYWKQASDQCIQARKEGKLEALKEIEQDPESSYAFKRGFENGKEEALKNLPRWKKCAPCEEDKATIPAWIVRFDADRANESAIVHDDYYICFGELEKLPGFKEK